MKNWTRIALFSSFISVCLHFYLLLHYYPLRFGFSQESAACNLNQTFNCDAVSSSQFADIFGIPLAAFGFACNMVLFVLIMMGWLNWSSDSRKFRALATQLSLGSVLVSIVLLVISFTALKQYCIVCLVLHVFAFLILVANLKIEKTTVADWMPTPLAGLKAGVVLSIPLVAFLIHKTYLQNYGANEVGRMVQNAVADWQTSQPKSFMTKPLLSKGAPAEKAKVVIREFADLLCGHCKTATPSLSAFAEVHQDDVRLEFYLFPLDGACNPEMKSAMGLSCALSRILVCSERQERGWATLKTLFDNQALLMMSGNVEEVTNKAFGFIEKLGLDQAKLRECANDPRVNEILEEQSRQGKLAGIEGTPTIYVSDKKLPRGQMVPVLQAVRKMILSSQP